MLQRLLFYRFLLFNTLVFVSLAVAEYYSWISNFVHNDKSYISLAIMLVFTGAIFYQGWRAWKTSKMIDVFKHAVKNNTVLTQYNVICKYDVDKLSILRDKDLKKIDWMHYISNWLLFMGLIGTVVGFIVATSGIPASGIDDTDALNSILSYLISGVGIALYTTLAGSIAGLIVEINAAMIHTALSNFWADLIKEIG